MKKLILTALSLVAGATLVHAQGYIEFFGSVADITTNSTVSFYGTSNTLGGASGKAVGATVVSGAFDYALLYATTTTAGDATPLGSDWNAVTIDGGGTLQGYNGNAPGSLNSASSSAGVEINIAAGTTVDVMLVGWSSALGSSWSSIENLLNDGFAGQSNPNLFFGDAGISTMTPFSTAGAGDPVIFTTMYPNGSLVLYSAIPVPEPATLALAGLGGLSMLFLRRRKS